MCCVSIGLKTVESSFFRGNKGVPNQAFSKGSQFDLNLIVGKPKGRVVSAKSYSMRVYLIQTTDNKGEFLSPQRAIYFTPFGVMVVLSKCIAISIVKVYGCALCVYGNNNIF